MTTNDVIELQKWWMSELKAISKKVLDQEERRQTKAREKTEKLLGEYDSFAAVQDAYGCGVISSRKRDRLYDLLEQRDMAVSPDRIYQMKVDMLTELYQMAKQIVEDNTK